MNQSNDKRMELDERLVNWAVRTMRALESAQAPVVCQNVVEQVMRAVTSAYVLHGERGTGTFLQHLKDCGHELSATRRGLILIKRMEWVQPPESLDELIEETDILSRIYFSSIRTVESKQGGGGYANGAAPAGGGNRLEPLDDMTPNWPDDAKPTPALAGSGSAARGRRGAR